MSRMVVFEDAGFANLLPLVYWRTVGALRCGRYTLGERAARRIDAKVTDLWCRDALAAAAAARSGLPVNAPATAGTLLVNARWLVTEPVEISPAPSIGELDGETVYVHCDESLADQVNATAAHEGDAPNWLTRAMGRSPARAFAGDWAHSLKRLAPVEKAPGRMIRYPWDLVSANGECLRQDLQNGRVLAGDIDNGVHLLNADAVHVAAGARVKPGAVLDAEDGPIYVDDGAVISPNVTIQGPCYIGERSLIQPGAVIREDTTIGPVCKVGGEVEASIIHGYTNKQHDGFLGHAYVGAWCNLGADTVNSDLKNTYGPVRVPINGREVDSGQPFVGLFMGDHSKTGINQAFSTGTVVGFCSSVATSTLSAKFVPSFSWLTDGGRADYDVERAIAVARKVMARRKVTMSDAEAALFRQIAEDARRMEQTRS